MAVQIPPVTLKRKNGREDVCIQNGNKFEEEFF